MGWAEFLRLPNGATRKLAHMTLFACLGFSFSYFLKGLNPSKFPNVITTISAEALFDTNSDVVRPDAKDKLMEIVRWMKEHSGERIIVEGHTDSIGGRDFNLNLSLRRAQSVKNFLVSQGVRASLISIDGYGYSRPVASNNSPEGRQRNRRVEVRQW